MNQLKPNSIRNFPDIPCVGDNEHSFKIMKGTGKKTGTPTWKCTKCKRKIQSS